ncbi:unnamed protein product [Lathyrus sativus]|nr:unnamed protein product [Lathyrus sativus]
MSYTQLLSNLIHTGAIIPKEIETTKFPYHPRHDPNATCGYHAGYVGHSTESCIIFKNKVQELLDQKLLYFTKKPCQNSILVISETSAEAKNKGPPTHVLIASAIQPSGQGPYQGFQSANSIVHSA